MKMNKKVNGKTWTKNSRHFYELGILRYIDFFLPLMKMRKDLGLPKIKEVVSAANVLGNNPTYNEWKKLSAIILRCKTNRLKFFSLFDQEEKQAFYSMIEMILKHNNLGHEWKLPLGDYVINGFFIPPLYNLDIQTDRNTKRVSLSLNPDTSMSDIKNAWKAIENAKKEVFGKLKRRNLTNKSTDDLVTLAKIKNLQKTYPRPKGLDLVGLLYPNNDHSDMPSTEDDRKTSNKLRQLKSRFNRKL